MKVPWRIADGVRCANCPNDERQLSRAFVGRGKAHENKMLTVCLTVSLESALAQRAAAIGGAKSVDVWVGMTPLRA
jgi:hypothetical protein